MSTLFHGLGLEQESTEILLDQNEHEPTIITFHGLDSQNEHEQANVTFHGLAGLESASLEVQPDQRVSLHYPQDQQVHESHSTEKKRSDEKALISSHQEPKNVQRSSAHEESKGSQESVVIQQRQQTETASKQDESDEEEDQEDDEQEEEEIEEGYENEEDEEDEKEFLIDSAENFERFRKIVARAKPLDSDPTLKGNEFLIPIFIGMPMLSFNAKFTFEKKWLGEHFVEVMNIFIDHGGMGNAVNILSNYQEVKWWISILDAINTPILEKFSAVLLCIALSQVKENDMTLLEYLLKQRSIGTKHLNEYSIILTFCLVDPKMINAGILLLRHGHKANYLYREGLGMLDLLLSPHFLSKQADLKKFFNGEKCLAFKELITLALNQGANPIHVINPLFSNPSFMLSEHGFGTYFEQLMQFFAKLDVHQNQDIKGSFIATFLQLLLFGGGFLNKRLRHAAEKEGTDAKKSRTELLRIIAEFSKDDLGMKPESFERDFSESEIVALGTTSQGKRVWLYTLREINDVLSGKRKDITLYNQERITQNILQARDDFLADHAKYLFSEASVIRVDASANMKRNQQYYREFQQAVSKMSEALFKSLDRNFDINAMIVLLDLLSFQPWIQENIEEVFKELLTKESEDAMAILILIYIKQFGYKKFSCFYDKLPSEIIRYATNIVLPWFVKQKKFEIVEYLLQTGLSADFFQNNLQDIVLELSKSVTDNILYQGARRDFEPDIYAAKYMLKCILKQAGHFAKQLVNYRDENSHDTPLHIFTQEYYQEECIEILLQAGANPCVINKKGFTPLANVLKHYRLADRNNYSKTLSLLFSYGAGFLQPVYRLPCENNPVLPYDDYYYRAIKNSLPESQWRMEDLQGNIHELSRKFFEIYCEADFLILANKAQSLLSSSGIKSEPKDCIIYLEILARLLFCSTAGVYISPGFNTRNYSSSPSIYSLDEHTEREELALENLSLVIENVLTADERLIAPSIKELFMKEIAVRLRLGDILKKFVSKDLANIIVSYLLSGPDLTKCAALMPADTLVVPAVSSPLSRLDCGFTREYFSQQSWKAYQWAQNKKIAILNTTPECAFNKLVFESDDREHKNSAEMQTLINNGLLVSMVKHRKLTPLLAKLVQAKKINYLKLIISEFLKLNGNPTALDFNEALLTALTLADMESARLLIESGAKLTFRSETGETVISAARKGNCMNAFFLLLKQKDIDVSLTDPNAKINSAFNQMLSESEDNDKTQARFTQLLNNGLLLINFLKPGRVIYRLIKENKPKLLRILLAAGADVHGEETCIMMPISFAITLGHLGCIEVLLDHKTRLKELDPSALSLRERAEIRAMHPGQESFLQDFLNLLKQKGRQESELDKRVVIHLPDLPVTSPAASPALSTQASSESAKPILGLYISRKGGKSATSPSPSPSPAAERTVRSRGSILSFFACSSSSS